MMIPLPSERPETEACAPDDDEEDDDEEEEDDDRTSYCWYCS